MRALFKVLIKRSRSVGHFCVSLFPLFGVYAAAHAAGAASACPATALGAGGGVGVDYDGPLRKAGVRGARGELVGVLGREAFIKLALSQHRAIIAE